MIKSSNDQIGTQEIIKDLDEKICHILYLTFREPFWLRKYEPGTKIDKDNFLIIFTSSNYKVLLHWINNLDYYQGDFQIIGEDVDSTKQSFSSSLSLDDFISQFSKTLSSWTKNGFIESSRQIESSWDDGIGKDNIRYRLFSIYTHANWEYLRNITQVPEDDRYYTLTDAIHDISYQFDSLEDIKSFLLTCKSYGFPNVDEKLAELETVDAKPAYKGSRSKKEHFWQNWFSKDDDALDRRQGLKDLYSDGYWELLDEVEDINDPKLLKIAPRLFYSAEDIRTFLLECARENLPGARDRLIKLNRLMGIKSSRQITSANSQEEFEDLIIDIEDKLGVNVEHSNIFNLNSELSDDVEMEIDDLCRRHNCKFVPVNGDRRQYRLIQSSRRNNMIKSAYTREEIVKMSNEGYRAFFDNKKITDCPYEDNSVEKDYWIGGYKGAEHLWNIRESYNPVKSAYTRPDTERFDEVGNFIPYNPTEEELAKKDEIKTVLKQELSDAYEPDPMDDYVGYDSTNERIDMACERVAKQFGVDTDFVDQIAGEIDRENIARANAEPEYVYQHCKDKDRFWDWYNGEDVSLEELGIDKEQMDKEVDEVVRKYVNSSRQIKSSPVTSDKQFRLIDTQHNDPKDGEDFTAEELKDYISKNDKYFDNVGLDYTIVDLNTGEEMDISTFRLNSSCQIQSKLDTVKVTFDNGDTIVTDYNADVGREEIAKYYMHNYFNVGGEDEMHQVVKVEFPGNINSARVPEKADLDMAYQLEGYIESDHAMYDQFIVPVVKNLERKMKRGIFDYDKSLILWQHVADEGAKRYVKELGGPSYNVATRKEVAKNLAEYYKENYDVNGDIYNPIN